MPTPTIDQLFDAHLRVCSFAAVIKGAGGGSEGEQRPSTPDPRRIDGDRSRSTSGLTTKLGRIEGAVYL
jgi:hypothetical protein